MNTSHNVYPVRYDCSEKQVVPDNRRAAEVAARLSLTQKKFDAVVGSLGAVTEAVALLEDASHFLRLEGATRTAGRIGAAARDIDRLHAKITTMLFRALNLVEGMNRGRAQ